MDETTGETRGMVEKMMVSDRKFKATVLDVSESDRLGFLSAVRQPATREADIFSCSSDSVD